MITPGDVITRNTEQDTPTQTASALDPRTLAVPVQSALYGGKFPDSSAHWAGFFKDKHANPYGVLGNKPGITQTPNVTRVMAQVSDPQNEVTGGSNDVWQGFFRTVFGGMRNGHNTSAYSAVR